MDRPQTRTNYDSTPYTGYDDTNNTSPFLFYGNIDSRAEAIDRVAAVDLGTGPVAYHFDFLKENPVINDRLGEIPLLVVFDPETESAFRSYQSDGGFSMVGSSTTFNRDLDGRELTFSQVDGALQDDQTGSTWTRWGMAIAGELTGSELDPIIHGDHFWFAWAAFKADTRLVRGLDQLLD
jgi:hypothetical protein